MNNSRPNPAVLVPPHISHAAAWKKLNYQLSEKPKPGLKKPVESNVSDDDNEHSDTDDFGFERPTFDGEKPSVVKYLRPDTGCYSVLDCSMLSMAARKTA